MDVESIVKKFYCTEGEQFECTNWDRTFRVREDKELRVCTHYGGPVWQNLGWVVGSMFNVGAESVILANPWHSYYKGYRDFNVYPLHCTQYYASETLKDVMRTHNDYHFYRIGWEDVGMDTCKICELGNMADMCGIPGLMYYVNEVLSLMERVDIGTFSKKEPRYYFLSVCHNIENLLQHFPALCNELNTKAYLAVKDKCVKAWNIQVERTSNKKIIHQFRLDD